MDFLSQIQFPLPARTTVLGVAACFLLFLVAAVLIEAIRRRRMMQGIVDDAWKSVDSIMDEKDFTESEKDMLSKILRRRAPRTPHQDITVRYRFEAIIDEEMADLEASGNRAEFERMGKLLRDIRAKLGLDFVALGQRIHSTRELYRSQEVWFSPEGTLPARWLRGTVTAVDEALVSVAPIAEEDTTVPVIQAGERVKFRLWREEDARYLYAVKFSHAEKDPVLLYFHHTTDLRRVQNRQYFRIGYDQPADVGVLGIYAEESDADGGGKRVVQKVRGRIVNISAGGCAIIFPQEVSLQHYVRVPLELEGSQPFTVDGQVISCAPLAGGRFLVRVTFAHIGEETIDTIAQFVIRRQQRVLESAEHSVV
ncbi:MAG: hypothetical protein AMXMBFR84_31500 [Candidatus Hydrogenedentota bacterium]